MPWLRKSGLCALESVVDFFSAVGQFTTKSCLRCDSECPGHASLGFLLCSGSVYDQRLPALR